MGRSQEFIDFDSLHVSLDIEACGEVVLSIGACTFDADTGDALASFYCVPSVKDQMAAGLRLDADALLWLLKQSDAARAAIYGPQANAKDEFTSFGAWFPKEAWTWAYPTSFDLPVIERAMKTFGLRPPWNWRRTMDGRTLWQLAMARDARMADVEKTAPEVEHHALSDAREQAKWYAKYLAAVLP